MRKLVAIIGRHGDTELNESNAFRSMLDPCLNRDGEKEAVELADLLFSKYKIYRITSSPMLRAIQTADVIAEKFGLKVKQDRALFPWQLGFLSGRDKDEYDAILQYYVDHPMEDIPQGQSLDKFEQRVGEFFEEKLRNTYAEDETGTGIGHYAEEGPYHCLDCIHKTAPRDPYCTHPTILESPQLKDRRMKINGKKVVQIDLQKGCCGYVAPTEPIEDKIQAFLTHTSVMVTLENLFRGNRDGRPEAGEEVVTPGGYAEIWETDDGYELVPVEGAESAKFGE